jgi:hypothetical protein
MYATTRLAGSLMWQAATPLYNDPRRSYHTLDGHVGGMYRWWERFGWAYDRNLDEGVLSHDAVLDGLGDHEARSAMWHAAVAGAPQDGPVAHLILSTERHVPIGGWGVGDPRLIALDLADFLDERATRANSRLLLDERRRFGDTRPEADIAKGMVSYLIGLETHLQPAQALDGMPFGAISIGVHGAIERLANGVW